MGSDPDRAEEDGQPGAGSGEIEETDGAEPDRSSETPKRGGAGTARSNDRSTEGEEGTEATAHEPELEGKGGFVWGGPVLPDRRAVDDGPTAAEVIPDEVIGSFTETAPSIPGVDPPEEPFVRSNYFDFGYLEEFREIDHYWVRKPFAFVSVLYDSASRTYVYHVSEPSLDEGERYIRDDLGRHLRDVLDWQEIYRGAGGAFESEILEVVGDFAGDVTAGSLHKVGYYLLRDFTGYGRIDTMMRDNQVEDISCDGADIPVFVYHQDFDDLPSNLRFEQETLDSIVRRLAQQAGRSISFANPVVSATLPRGDRVQLILGDDVSRRGPTFTIRRYQEIPLTPVDLIRFNTFSTAEMAYLWLCIEHQKSVIFVGPTASGKTTSMNASSLFIRPYAKVVSIERTPELSIPHDNWVSTVTRETGRDSDSTDVSVYDLLHSALHQRPEYIIVGEIRTEPEVLLTFLQSVFTGHAGYTTFHAYDVEEAVGRFRASPFDASDQMIASIDVISVQRQVSVGDDRKRRTVRITELDYAGDGQIETTEAFSWDPGPDAHRQREDMFDLATLQDIAGEHGWSRAKILAELDQRADFLQYLVDAEIDDFEDVWASIFAFSRDRAAVAEEVKAGTFDPTSIAMNYYD